MSLATSAALLAGCAQPPQQAAPSDNTAMQGNPFAEPSTLPYQLPPFDRIQAAHFEPAFAAGMQQQRQEVATIAANPEPPTFDNTIVALERSGRLLLRVRRVFFALASAHNSDEIRRIEAEIAPKFAAHNDAIRLDPALYARIDALYAKRDQLGLDAESLQLLTRYRKQHQRAGAALAAPQQARLREINTELSKLTTRYVQNVQRETNDGAVWVNSADELAGLSAAEIARAAAEAQTRGQPGRYVLPLVNTSGQPPLADLQNRALRERLHRASLSRGLHGNADDNRALVQSIVGLRAERAALLGYPSHAAYQLDDRTAGTPAAVDALMAQLAPPALANAKREAAAMQQLIDREAPGTTLAAWDWAYYAERLRRKQYAYDEAQLRPYFELNRVFQDGICYTAEKLYGLRFTERKDLPVYHPDVRVFEVFDADGSGLGLFLLDPYARPSKRGGAWMNLLVDPTGLYGTQPVATNTLNVQKPMPGEPALMTLDDVITAFHEFGHGLHGLLSKVRYPLLAGTNVPLDFVEYPSQVFEMWALWPEVLQRYARHSQTGAPLPPELAKQVQSARAFNQGFATLEYLAATALDQAWYRLSPQQVPADVEAFEADALQRAGLAYAPVPPRYRSTYFSHVFSGGGYDAGYYAYIWAEVLDADTVEWFKENGGLTRANGDRFRAAVLSRGYSGDTMAMFRQLRGREPDITPLLRRRGLEPVASAAR